MTTFAVDSVEKATATLSAVDSKSSITRIIQVELESCFKFPDSLIPVGFRFRFRNALMGAVHTAYDQHYPLVLSPDMIWQCVAQGFAIHVNKNAEELRHMFVEHEGKKEITVRRDDFIKGSPDNNWESVFGDFSEEIRKNVGDEIHSLLTPEFSTTGPVERAAAQVVLMNAFKEYFEYTLMSRCGIPEVTLEGNVDDWKKLREKTLALAKFNLQWWTDNVKSILDEFVQASSGVVNVEFWKSIYKIDNFSGGPYISGWIVGLFPYLGRSLSEMRPNKKSFWPQDDEQRYRGVTTSSFPQGFVSTPFMWQYLREEFAMTLYAGFMGVGQDKKTLALRPVIGWAVVDKEEEEKAKMNRRLPTFRLGERFPG